jgi:hypothetical protein
MASEFKHNKVIERQRLKEIEIGIDNKKCSKCNRPKYYHHSLYYF